MKTTTQHSLFKPIAKLFKKFHLTIFFIMVAAGISGAVFLMNNTLEETVSSTEYTSPISAGSIDQTTLERVKALHASSEEAPTTEMPPGRINPFGE